MATRIGIIGYAGRMGQAIGRAIQAQSATAVLAGGLVRQTMPDGNGPVFITTKPGDLAPLCDVIVDFSAADALAAHVDLASELGKAFVCGITGLDEQAQAILRTAAKRIPVLYAANTSLSLAVMQQVVRLTAQLLKDQDYDVAILDRHHRWKKDAPSGTAKSLGDAVTQGNGGARLPAYAAIRAGAIVGEHEVSFTGQGESIILQHSVTDRAIFARGAVEAALWLHGKAAGFYGMEDVVGCAESQPKPIRL